MNHSSVHLIGEGQQPTTTSDRDTVRLSYAPGAPSEFSQLLAQFSALQGRVSDLEATVAGLQRTTLMLRLHTPNNTPHRLRTLETRLSALDADLVTLHTYVADQAGLWRYVARWVFTPWWQRAVAWIKGQPYA